MGENGWENGPFGYPTSGEQHPGDGQPANHRVQFFEHGFLYWDGYTVMGEWTDQFGRTAHVAYTTDSLTSPR
ncbi:hypothetical protein [Parenemella sanctibonifatiensis]|uniref:hypothetical protein n=1 Tax=Parenemella sanctibonifatiensis TaxID=2016505 RepID=UPI001E3E07C8|nr:hypothetical protein [Parenemella sanctibonifatiensis]